MSYETEAHPDRVEFLIDDARSLETRLASIDSYTAGILSRALAGARPSVDEGAHLFGLRGNDLAALVAAADHVRREDVGDVVTYVVNRNVNWTNICFVGCKFCAFAHLKTSPLAYDNPIESVIERIRDGVHRGATEVCMQGGINPEMPSDGYFKILRAVREAFPSLHIHAYSPMEIFYGARRSQMDYRSYIAELVASGLNTIPGTAAEILDDEVREILSHKKLDTATWVEIIRTAHSLGVPTTSTIMYGHIETPAHWVRHMDLLRSIQKDTGGFTEFVPLSLIHSEAPMYSKKLVPGVRPGATGVEVVRMHALARVFLGPVIPNVQASWVKEGPKLAQILLDAGANDLGGTLINESISTSAGAAYGQLVPPAELRRLVRDAGRAPAQRDTLYNILRTYKDGDEDDSPLDRIEDAESRFGSYRRLVASGEFRFTQR